MSFLDAVLADVPTTAQDALALFDSLPPVDTDAMIGTWRGAEVPTRHRLDGLLPQRLAHSLAGAWLPDRIMAEQPDKTLRQAAARLSQWSLTPSGSEGYAKAEVMLGGVDTGQLSSRSLEAKSVPGLYVIGEAVDVTGWLGGYNFQWAWASGTAAALATAEQRAGG